MNQNHIVTNNIVMNNYINFGNSPNTKENERNAPNQQDPPIDDIMRYFTSRYKNILPHRLNMNFDFKSMLFPFERNQIVELLQQMDILVQLLLQNLLFSFNEETKMKTYELLLKILNKKAFVISYLEYLPTYQIYLSKFKPDPQSLNPNGDGRGSNPNKYSLYFEAKPQMSILQSPLLEFAELFIEIKRKVHCKEKLKEALLQFEPLIQRNWIPIFHDASYNQVSARTKFTYVDDCLLLLGLCKFGAKKLELIQEQFLPEKKVSEIRNRYKNLICGRAADNKIKRWKVLQFAPLREDEKINLQRGIEWFGSKDKVHLIARYFLTERSVEFIQSELNGGDNLKKKRKKYASLITPTLLSSDFSMHPHQPMMEGEEQSDESEGAEEKKHIYHKKPSFSHDIAPNPSFSPLRREEEKMLENIEHSQSEFEKISIGYSQGEDKMTIEDENKGKKMFLREENSENFEIEEIGLSPLDPNMGEEEIILEGSSYFNKKAYKMIGNEVFEYEEL